MSAERAAKDDTCIAVDLFAAQVSTRGTRAGKQNIFKSKQQRLLSRTLYEARRGGLLSGPENGKTKNFFLLGTEGSGKLIRADLNDDLLEVTLMRKRCSGMWVPVDLSDIKTPEDKYTVMAWCILALRVPSEAFVECDALYRVIRDIQEKCEALKPVKPVSKRAKKVCRVMFFVVSLFLLQVLIFCVFLFAQADETEKAPSSFRTAWNDVDGIKHSGETCAWV